MNNGLAHTSPRIETRLMCAAVVVGVTLLSLWPVVTFDFVDWDDPQTTAPAEHFWKRPQGNLYIPITYSVWSVLRTVGSGADPAMFHAANLLVHACTAVIVWKILMLLLGNRPAVATIGALVFAVHPVQVEAVAWVSGMKDLLCGLLSMVAIYHYLLAATGNARSAGGAYLIATIAFILALLSKPTAMVVPVIVGAIDVGMLRRPLRRMLPVLGPWIVLSVATMVVAKLAQPAPEVVGTSPIWARPLVALDALAFYLRQLIYPARLCLDYGRSPARLVGSWTIYVSWIVPVAIAMGLMMHRKRVPTLLAAAVVFLAGVSPVLGLASFDFQQYSTVADHYLYLSMLGAALAVAWLFDRIDPRLVVRMGVLLILALAARSFVQTWVWRDTLTLFRHNLAVNPQSWASHVQLTYHALHHNDPAGAERHARAALRFIPDNGQARLNYGLALAMAGKMDEAIAEFDRAIQLMPNDPEPRKHLSDALEFQAAASRAATTHAATSRPSTGPSTRASTRVWLRYLALGDSYTIGESVDPSQRWPVQLAAMLRTQKLEVAEPRIIARTGWTTDELSRAIDAENPQGPYQLVSLLIGVNNQYRGRSADEFREQFRALLRRSISFAGDDPKRVIVLSIPDWGATPFAEGKDRAKIAREIDEFNKICRDESAARGVNFIDITPISRQAVSDPALIAGDGLHPSARMYRLWCEQALPAATGALAR